MNWRRLFFICGALMLAQFGGAQPKVSLDFEVAGMPDGYCRIIGMLGGQNFLVDSIKKRA